MWNWRASRPSGSVAGRLTKVGVGRPASFGFSAEEALA